MNTGVLETMQFGLLQQDEIIEIINRHRLSLDDMNAVNEETPMGWEVIKADMVVEATAAFNDQTLNILAEMFNQGFDLENMDPVDELNSVVTDPGFWDGLKQELGEYLGSPGLPSSPYFDTVFPALQGAHWDSIMYVFYGPEALISLQVLIKERVMRKRIRARKWYRNGDANDTRKYGYDD